MGVMVVRKIPALKELPLETGQEVSFSHKTAEKIKEQFRKINIFSSFSPEKFLHVSLSKIRILSLKIENITGHWLGKIRQKNIERKNNFKEGYWEKIKKEKDKNKPE
jgi:hypothetical protein